MYLAISISSFCNIQTLLGTSRILSSLTVGDISSYKIERSHDNVLLRHTISSSPDLTQPNDSQNNGFCLPWRRP
jgi:hypothetical protein